MYVVISAIICNKSLVTLMNSFPRWGLSYALDGKSAEYVFGFMKLMGHQPKICHDQVSAMPATSVIHFSLRGCQIIFFMNCIFSVHIFIFHKCRLHYLMLVEKWKGWDGFYAGDWWPSHLPCSFEAHGIL